MRRTEQLNWARNINENAIDGLKIRLSKIQAQIKTCKDDPKKLEELKEIESNLKETLCKIQ